MTSQWRLILRDYLEKNPEEKRSIAKHLGASVRSIDRWIEDGSRTDPERTRILKLVKVVPGHESVMRLSLERDYPDVFERASENEIMSNIPSAFYARTQETRATTARNLARNTIMQTVFKQMSGHLDPDEDGLMILFAQCVKPIELDGRVTALTVHTSGYGTNKWQYRQIERAYMVGAGSLCAMAVVRGDMALYPEDTTRIDRAAPILYGEEIRSCATFPVLKEGDVAGALFVAASLPEFFTETQRSLIKSYSYSFALALRDHEFYPQSQIDLQPMPSLTHQGEIYRGSQQFLEDLARQYPKDTPDQLEKRARQIFDQCLSVIKEKEKEVANVE